MQESSHDSANLEEYQSKHRKTLKSLTHCPFTKEMIECQPLNITSTKRHFSFDQISNHEQIDQIFEEEKKAMEIKKRNENKKKKVVECENVQILENVKFIEREMSTDTENMIRQALGGHFLFGNMDLVQIEGIVKLMFACTAKKNEYIFKEGQEASSFFIVESGLLEVRINGNTKRYLKKSDGFGELALLYNSARSASILVIEESILWGIDRANFKRVVQETIIKEFTINRRFINGVDVFNCLSYQQKDELASCVISQKYMAGQTIVNEGDPANCFYIINKGVVVAYKDNKQIREIKEGNAFGESALLYNSIRQMTIKAKDNCVILALPKKIIAEILGDHIGVIAFRNLQKWGLEKSSILKNLTTVQTELLIDRMIIKYEKAGSSLFKEGDLKGQKIVLMHEGIVKTKKDDTIFEKGSLWGAEEMMLDSNEKFDDDYYFVNDSVVSVIAKDVLEEVLGNKLEIIIKKNVNSYERKIKYSLRTEVNKNEINLDELIFIKELGSGHYGSVYLVNNVTKNELFALKAISKQRIIENRIEKHLKQEKSVLEAIEFPFIVNFVKTLKDEINIYFLMEYIKGMDLFDVIRKIGLLSTYDAQYYISSIILAIEYLHLNNIIHRDIKPENIMVDYKGATKLIDMGTAKFLHRSTEKHFQKTFTIIGTPHYMAPEIVKSKGYSFPVDYWSIGICFYEFMCGMLPFGEDTEDPYEIYEEILKKEIKYPSYLKDKKGRRLMNQLLSKVPEVRINGSIGSLKADPWFGNFDWDELIEGQLKPPYVCDDLLKSIEAEIQQKLSERLFIKDYIKKKMDFAPGRMKVMASKLEDNWDDYF